MVVSCTTACMSRRAERIFASSHPARSTKPGEQPERESRAIPPTAREAGDRFMPRIRRDRTLVPALTAPEREPDGDVGAYVELFAARDKDAEPGEG